MYISIDYNDIMFTLFIIFRLNYAVLIEYILSVKMIGPSRPFSLPEISGLSLQQKGNQGPS